MANEKSSKSDKSSNVNGADFTFTIRSLIRSEKPEAPKAGEQILSFRSIL